MVPTLMSLLKCAYSFEVVIYQEGVVQGGEKTKG